MEELKTLCRIVGTDFEIGSPLSEESLRLGLVSAFSYLIDHDLSKMMTILYRADVNEDKLKILLAESVETPAAEVIAGAYLNRQKEKIETWKKYSR
nr:hypothetical protein [Pedobacter sp. ASV19]